MHSICRSVSKLSTVLVLLSISTTLTLSGGRIFRAIFKKSEMPLGTPPNLDGNPFATVSVWWQNMNVGELDGGNGQWV